MVMRFIEQPSISDAEWDDALDINSDSDVTDYRGVAESLIDAKVAQFRERIGKQEQQIKELAQLLNLNESGVSAVMAAIEGKRKAEQQITALEEKLKTFEAISEALRRNERDPDGYIDAEGLISAFIAEQEKQRESNKELVEALEAHKKYCETGLETDFNLFAFKRDAALSRAKELGR